MELLYLFIHFCLNHFCDPTSPPPHPQLPIRKNEQKIYLKTIESAKTGLITKPHSVWASYMHGSLIISHDSVQKFIEIQGWLLLTLSICLHNQLSSLNSIIVQMSGKHNSLSRQ